MSTDVVSITPQEAVQLGAASLIDFGHIFLPKTFRQASPEFHHEIGRALYAPVRQNLILVYRDGAKTTLLRAFLLQRICYGISHTIQIVSASQDHSIHSVRWLKRQIERNPLLLPFGLKPGAKWTDEWIAIENTITGESTNVLAVGITGQVRGFNLDDYRPDLIVCDDILTDESTRTEEQRKKTSDLFYGAIVNSLAAATESASAKIVLLQTPFDTNDLAMACANDPSWHPIVFGILDAEDKSTWEAKFPTATVQKERTDAIQAGRKKVWYREKMCLVLRTEEVLLNSDLLKFWTKLPAKSKRFLAIDPASASSPRADSNVVMTICIDGPDVYVARYNATKGTMPDECAAYFFAHVADFGPFVRAGVETVSYQRVLKWYIETEMRKRRLFVPIVPIDDKRSKPDKILQHLPQLLAYGNLYIHPSMISFIQQMDDYDASDKAKDDILDACAMALKLAGNLLQSPYELENKAPADELDESEYAPLIFRGGCP